MCPLAQHGCWRACCQARLGGGGAPDAGSGPSPREFLHGGADACTPRQGVTLLYGPSICTRSVQMDLRHNQVRRPFPTPGSGTLWVSEESLRDRHVSCLPRWTVCPTRSPSQDTNRSTCRGECSWSSPLATPPGRCHLGPLANGPGRNPPYCSRSDGADTDTGGAPKPQSPATSPALFAGSCHPGPLPLVPASQLSPPGASPCPAPLAVPPGSRHVPFAPTVCPCSCVLVSFVVRFVFFFPLPPPTSPPCLPAVLALFVGGRRRRGRGGGGGRSRCPPYCASTSEARRRHEARHLSLRWGGGGLLFGSRRHPTLPAVAPPAAPPLGLARRVLPLGTVVWFVPHSRPSTSPPCRGVLGGGIRRPLPSSLLPPRRLPVALASFLGGCGRWGRGGGGGAPSLPFLRRKHVAGTAPTRGTALVLLLGCGARRVAPVFALPTMRSLPRCPPRRGLLGACVSWARSCCPSRTLPPQPPLRAALSSGGGAAVRPSLPASPTLGGTEACGGGGALSFSLRCSRVAGTRRGFRPSAGGGGGLPPGSLRRPFYPTPAPPVVPPPELARRAPSSGTVVWLVPHPPTSASPACRVALGGGGGGALFAPPLSAFPALGEAVVLWGGRGALFASRPLHARRRHDVGTTQPRGEALGCCRRGGGGFPLGFPALLHGIGPALQDHQPLLPPRR